MTPSLDVRRLAFAFGIAFAVFYPIAIKLDWALFTVFPAIGVVLPGTHHAADIVDPAVAFINPAMYWYGWTATAALAAIVVGLAAGLVPDAWVRRFWSGWVWLAPLLAMAACIYLTIPWFRR